MPFSTVEPAATPEKSAAAPAACAASKGLNARLPTDWGGMVTGSYMEYILAKLAGSPRIADCRDIYLHDAIWNPKSRELKLDYTPGPKATIVIDAGGQRKVVDPAPAGIRRKVTLNF